MAEIDLTWAHPSLAERVRKTFLHIRQDSEGRLNVNDTKLRFQRHARALLGDIERIDGYERAFLAENWQTVLKDWAMCAGIWPYCPHEDPVWAKTRPTIRQKHRKKLCHV
jgi:hypothetical protein